MLETWKNSMNYPDLWLQLSTLQKYWLRQKNWKNWLKTSMHTRYWWYSHEWVDTKLRASNVLLGQAVFIIIWCALVARSCLMELLVWSVIFVLWHLAYFECLLKLFMLIGSMIYHIIALICWYLLLVWWTDQPYLYFFIKTIIFILYSSASQISLSCGFFVLSDFYLVPVLWFETSLFVLIVVTTFSGTLVRFWPLILSAPLIDIFSGTKI